MHRTTLLNSDLPPTPVPPTPLLALSPRTYSYSYFLIYFLCRDLEKSHVKSEKDIEIRFMIRFFSFQSRQNTTTALPKWRVIWPAGRTLPDPGDSAMWGGQVRPRTCRDHLASHSSWNIKVFSAGHISRTCCRVLNSRYNERNNTLHQQGAPPDKQYPRYSWPHNCLAILLCSDNYLFRGIIK